MPSARALTAAAAAAAACLAGAGCSPGKLPASAPRWPAPQLLDQAESSLTRAAGLTVTGTVREHGATLTSRIKLRPGTGCTGSQTVSGSGTMQVTMIGRDLWFHLDQAGWDTDAGLSPADIKNMQSSQFSSLNPQQLIQILAPKWLQAPAGDTSMLARGAEGICAMSVITSQIPPAGNVTESAVTTADGKEDALTSRSWDTTVYVTTGTHPRITRITFIRPGTAGTYDVTYGPLALTPPPRNMVIPASSIGD